MQRKKHVLSPLFMNCLKCVLCSGRPADQPQACSVIPPQQEPGAQAPASDPHHDASQRPAPAYPNPPSGTGNDAFPQHTMVLARLELILT